jgi:hypothetical protein
MGRMPAVAALLGALSITLPSAWAQSSPSLPAPVQAAVRESREACAPDKATLGKGFVQRRDVNGDGVEDYVLDYAAFDCGGSSTYFCGSSGCLTQVFASLKGGRYAKVLDENVQDIQFKQIKGRAALLIGLHGSGCGRAGAAPCHMTLYWNGERFSPAN